MRLEKVDYIPKQIHDGPRKKVYQFVEDFIRSDMDYAKVILEPGDYVRPESARQSFMRACERCGYGVSVKTRNGDIYLVRRSAEL